MTIQNGLVLVGDLDDDTPSVHELGVVRLRGENDVALVIEEGAIIDVKNELWAFAVESWGWNIGWRDNYGVVLWGSTKTEAPATANAQGGDLTIRLDGEIKLDQSYLGAKLSADGSVIQGPDTIINPATDAELTWSQYGSNGNALSLFSQDTDNDRNDNDILIELGATGVIRNVAGSVGGNGIYADQRTEAGGITINLAKGSLIDVSAEGGRGLNAWLLRTGECKGSDPDPNDDEMVLCDPRQTGDIVIGAHGTIRAAVKRKVGNTLQGSGISAYMGVATSEAMGRLRIVSSGTIETVQGPGIDARISSPANAQVDDPDTAAIEGHLIDVTGGRIVAKGSSAIGATTAGADAAWTIRVARGATVRAEGRAGPRRHHESDAGRLRPGDAAGRLPLYRRRRNARRLAQVRLVVGCRRYRRQRPVRPRCPFRVRHRCAARRETVRRRDRPGADRRTVEVVEATLPPPTRATRSSVTMMATASICRMAEPSWWARPDASR